MTAPGLIRGAAAIGAHLGISAADAARRHAAGTIPTWRAGGTPYATAAALDDWRALEAAGRLPAN